MMAAELIYPLPVNNPDKMSRYRKYVVHANAARKSESRALRRETDKIWVPAPFREFERIRRYR